MRAYGYEKGKAPQTGPLELREITLTGAPATIRELAHFLLAAADQKEQRQRERFWHVHIREERQGWHEKWPDIAVS